MLIIKDIKISHFVHGLKEEGVGEGEGEGFLHITTDRFNNTFASRSLQFFFG